MQTGIRLVGLLALFLWLGSTHGWTAEEMDKARVDEIVAIYCAAWSEPREVVRRQMLEKVWATDGTYTDPTAHVVGREALSTHIAAFHQQFPGASIVVSTRSDHYRKMVRFGWKMVLADGSTALEGLDFGELDSNERLQNIIGFFGPLDARP